MLIKYLFKKIKQGCKTRGSGRNFTGQIVLRSRRNMFKKAKNPIIDLYNCIDKLFYSVIKIYNKSQINSFISLNYYHNTNIFTQTISLEFLTSFIFRVSNFYLNSNLKYSYNCDDTVNSFIGLFPLGSFVSQIELVPGRGVSLARSSGVCASLVNHIKLITGKEFIGVLLPSKILIYLSFFCKASLGFNSNFIKNVKKNLSAGSLKKRGRRSKVRGVAMNPVDHPHGGGEGKTSGGRVSVSRWGFLTKGKKTTSFVKKRKKKEAKLRLQALCV